MLARSGWEFLEAPVRSCTLSDHHVPLLFTVSHPVARLDKPSPNTVSRTPEYHLGPVALSPADTADFQSSVLRRRDIDPQLALARWLKGLQQAIYDWAHTVGRVRALRFRHYRLRTRPAEPPPPLEIPPAVVLPWCIAAPSPLCPRCPLSPGWDITQVWGALLDPLPKTPPCRPMCF